MFFIKRTDMNWTWQCQQCFAEYPVQLQPAGQYDPFDKLVLRKKVNAASYNRLIVATTLIFVLTFLSPLAIVRSLR